jgi:hypothetical protein
MWSTQPPHHLREVKRSEDSLFGLAPYLRHHVVKGFGPWPYGTQLIRPSFGPPVKAFHAFKVQMLTGAVAIDDRGPYRTGPAAVCGSTETNHRLYNYIAEIL